MDNLKERLGRFKNMNFSVLPTPIQYLGNISDEFGFRLYTKRDDLTGFAFGGNKTRKLDYLIGDALKKGFDTIIGIGANQSNFCRMATAAGTVTGLEVHLVLGGKKPENPTGNLKLDRLYGAVIHHIDSKDWDDWFNQAEQLKMALEKGGKKVYLLPVGGSTSIGALGYIKAYLEILDYEKVYNIKFDKILHASSSGGTQAGLVVADYLTGGKPRIIGIAAAKDKQTLEREVFELANETGKLFDVKVPENYIEVNDRFVGQEYGIVTDLAKRAMKMFARLEGIDLDPVYTGKAASALLDLKQEFKGQNILFIHTGGLGQLYI